LKSPHFIPVIGRSGLYFNLHSRQIANVICISTKHDSDHAYKVLIIPYTMLPHVIYRKKVFMYTLTYSATHSPPFIASSHVYLNEFHH
jgi:hypothetical protein